VIEIQVTSLVADQEHSRLTTTESEPVPPAEPIVRVLLVRLTPQRTSDGPVTVLEDVEEQPATISERTISERMSAPAAEEVAVKVARRISANPQRVCADTITQASSALRS
jgi:hypothetical protein